MIDLKKIDLKFGFTKYKIYTSIFSEDYKINVAGHRLKIDYRFL